MTASGRVRWAALGLALSVVCAAAVAAVPATVRGPIVAVVPEDDSFTVADENVGEIVILVGEGAEILLDGEIAILEDLFEGDFVLSAELGENADGEAVLVRAVVTSEVDPES
jgi:hypothetical protein